MISKLPHSCILKPQLHFVLEPRDLAAMVNYKAASLNMISSNEATRHRSQEEWFIGAPVA